MMLLNLVGIFWSVIVINIFNMFHTARKPPDTLLKIMETLTCQQVKAQHDKEKDTKKLSHVSNDVNTEECHEKLVYRNIFEINSSDHVGQRITNRIQGINMAVNSEIENYVYEWRMVVRGLDKVIFVCTAILTSVTALIVVLPNFE